MAEYKSHLPFLYFGQLFSNVGDPFVILTKWQQTHGIFSKRKKIQSVRHRTRRSLNLLKTYYRLKRPVCLIELSVYGLIVLSQI